MTVNELITKLQRFKPTAEVLICYDSEYCKARILDVYEDGHDGYVLLSEDMERSGIPGAEDGDE